MNACRLFFGFVALALCAVSSAALADQVGDDDQASKPTTRQNDPRLPAVLPGEEIVTETGQKMRVWSSAGPVPVNPMPTPQQIFGNGTNGAGLGIIVDGREGGGGLGPLGGGVGRP
jgi:hypothetical protein